MNRYIAAACCHTTFQSLASKKKCCAIILKELKNTQRQKYTVMHPISAQPNANQPSLSNDCADVIKLSEPLVGVCQMCCTSSTTAQVLGFPRIPLGCVEISFGSVGLRIIYTMNHSSIPNQKSPTTSTPQHPCEKHKTETVQMTEKYRKCQHIPKYCRDNQESKQEQQGTAYNYNN